LNYRKMVIDFLKYKADNGIYFKNPALACLSEFGIWLDQKAAEQGVKPTLPTLPVNLDYKGGVSPQTKLHVKSQSG